jgi:hypothetical protein
VEHKTQAQFVIEQAIVFGLPDKLYECDCDCDPVTIVRAVMGAIFTKSIRPAVRDYLDQLDTDGASITGVPIHTNSLLEDGQVAIIQLCPYCKRLVQGVWYRGKGCERCGGLGIQGAIIDNVKTEEESGE